MIHNKLIILGAGGHGRVVADVAVTLGYYSEILFLDDADIVEKNIAVIGKIADFVRYIDSADFFVAVGNNETRKKLFERLKSHDANVVSLVHPNAVVCRDVTLGAGCVVMAGSVVNTGSKIGNGVIINTSSSVDHDCLIGDFSHVSVGVHLAGVVADIHHRTRYHQFPQVAAAAEGTAGDAVDCAGYRKGGALVGRRVLH